MKRQEEEAMGQGYEAPSWSAVKGVHKRGGGICETRRFREKFKRAGLERKDRNKSCGKKGEERKRREKLFSSSRTGFQEERKEILNRKSIGRGISEKASHGEMKSFLPQTSKNGVSCTGR